MTGSAGVTVGVDVGTTSVKAVAVDETGEVLARTRVGHDIVTTTADQLEHRAGQAWRRGPRRAFTEVMAAVDRPVAGVTVSTMVPSLTAVNRRGVPQLPGLLYGDARGISRDPSASAGGMPDAEGFLEWAVAEAPGAAGYWPAQAVATHALSGIGAIDTAVAASMGRVHRWGKWNEPLLDEIGVALSQMPVVGDMCAAVGTIPGTDTVVTGGTVDAFCDQIVSGATETGDVLVIFGATMVVWIVVDDWVEVPGFMTVPHTTPGKVLVGGPSNAGALFVDWARRMIGSTGSGRAGAPVRSGDPTRVPVWLPYVRGERTPFHDPGLRSSLHGLDFAHGPHQLERAAFEASGFVLRRYLERTGVSARRIVASGGGTKVAGWMSAVADATGLPVETVGVPEGAAYGAAFMARMAAGLESSLDAADRWSHAGARFEPDPAWAAAASERYRTFDHLGTG